LRRAFYLQRQAPFAAKTSFVFFITVACLLWLAAKTSYLDGFSVFVILAVGWITAGATFGRKLALGQPEKPFLQIEPRYWREHWNYTKWVLATALVFQFTTQAYYWLVAGFLSAKEAGELRAMYMLVSPMDQMFIALSFLVIPALSARHAAKDIGRFLYIWKRYVLVTLGVTGTFALAVRLMGRHVLHVIYAGKYDDLVPYLFVLALLPILTGIGSAMNNAVIATEKPKLVFVAYVCSGTATFLGGILLVVRFGLRGSVYGMLLSAATFTGALALAFFFLVRRQIAAGHAIGSANATEEKIA
jgi:O-antigen/teichoic acid export membrane protein